MSTILKREQAPISDAAWQEIDSQAARSLQNTLVARKIVDFCGPHGWEAAAVNTGRLDVKDQPQGKLTWGVRRVLPLIEVRVPFHLSQMELDNVVRGAKDPDLDALEAAAREAALFEDGAVFNGFAANNITGMIAASDHEPLPLPQDGSAYPGLAVRATTLLRDADIGGPYALVLGNDEYIALLAASSPGYPPYQAVLEILGGGVYVSPAIQGGLIASTRGGDFELSVGVDFAVGFADRDRHNVELYLTESFTFRVLEPRAIIPLRRA